MINLHERMLPTSAGAEPATSWSPIGRRIQLSHRGRQGTVSERLGNEANVIEALHSTSLCLDDLLNIDNILNK